MDAIDRLVAEGHAIIEPDGHLTLIASDGVHLDGGSVGGKWRAAALAYLVDYPTPDTW